MSDFWLDFGAGQWLPSGILQLDDDCNTLCIRYDLSAYKPIFQLMQFCCHDLSFGIDVQDYPCFISDRSHYVRALMSQECMASLQLQRTGKTWTSAEGCIAAILKGYLIVRIADLSMDPAFASKGSIGNVFPKLFQNTRVIVQLENINWIGGDGLCIHGPPSSIEIDKSISEHLGLTLSSFINDDIMYRSKYILALPEIRDNETVVDSNYNAPDTPFKAEEPYKISADYMKEVICTGNFTVLPSASPIASLSEQSECFDQLCLRDNLCLKMNSVSLICAGADLVFEINDDDLLSLGEGTNELLDLFCWNLVDDGSTTQKSEPCSPSLCDSPRLETICDNSFENLYPGNIFDILKFSDFVAGSPMFANFLTDARISWDRLNNLVCPNLFYCRSTMTERLLELLLLEAQKLLLKGHSLRNALSGKTLYGISEPSLCYLLHFLLPRPRRALFLRSLYIFSGTRLKMPSLNVGANGGSLSSVSLRSMLLSIFLSLVAILVEKDCRRIVICSPQSLRCIRFFFDYMCNSSHCSNVNEVICLDFKKAITGLISLNLSSISENFPVKKFKSAHEPLEVNRSYRTL